MAFDPLSLLVLKFRGRNVAVFRDHCAHYEVSRPTINNFRWSDSSRVAGTEHSSRRTEQLPRPAGRSRREHRSSIGDP